MSLRLLRGKAALARVNDAKFVAQWSGLWQACPWATSLQSPEFVRLWYRSYEVRFEAVLIEETDAAGALLGLMTLAIPARSRLLVGAGADQAEYQGWLAREQDGDAFFLRCLATLRTEFRGSTIAFPNLTPGAPLGWYASSRPWRRATELREDVRGLMPFGDGTSLERSLRKKSNRSRLNRLERLGPVTLERVTSVAELEAILDEIATLYDLRQGALNGITPFRDDPLKRQFHIDLLGEAGLLHVTVLRAGGTIVSAHLDLRTRDEILLCVIAHAPRFARHSPGKFHILLLGKQLAQEGIRAFDLSPGGEYKDRFATTHEKTYSARIYLGAIPAGLARTRRAARGLLSKMGIEPRRARQLWAGTSRLATRRALRRAVRRLAAAIRGERAEHRVKIFRLPRPPAGLGPIAGVSRDRLADVVELSASAPAGGLERQEVLRQALERLEEGDHVFTHRGPQAAVTSGWLAHRGSAVRLGGSDLEFTLPGLGSMLYDITGDDRSGLIRAMLATAHEEAPDEPVFVVTIRTDPAQERLLQELGFQPDASLADRVRRVGAPRKKGEAGRARGEADDAAASEAP